MTDSLNNTLASVVLKTAESDSVSYFIMLIKG